MTRLKKLMEWAALSGDVHAHYSYQDLDKWYFSGRINGKEVDFNYRKHGSHIVINGTANVNGTQYNTLVELLTVLE